jgi:hypothetical protein
MIFSPTEGAFEGFRLTARHPVGVLCWAGVMLAANLLVGLAIGGIAGPQWAEFEQLAASTSPDTAQMTALLPRVVPAALISMLVQVVAASVVNASVLRALLRPEGHVTIGFGKDELRVIGLLLAFFGVSFAATLVLGVAMGLLGPLLGAGIVTLSSFASIVVTILLFIRFSLAGPMTIAEHRFRFWPSWKATKGWSWALLGSEALGASLALVVVMLAHIIFVAVVGVGVIATGGAFTQEIGAMFSPDFSTIDSLMRPLPLIYVAFLSVLYAIALAILNGPPIELYRSLRPAGKLDD